MAIFAALHRNGNGNGNTEALREHVVAALAALAAEHEADRDTVHAIREVLDASLAFLDRVLGSAGLRPTSAELDAFACATGPQLLHMTTLATRVQLTALHEVVCCSRPISRPSCEAKHVIPGHAPCSARPS